MSVLGSTLWAGGLAELAEETPRAHCPAGAARGTMGSRTRAVNKGWGWVSHRMGPCQGLLGGREGMHCRGLPVSTSSLALVSCVLLKDISSDKGEGIAPGIDSVREKEMLPFAATWMDWKLLYLVKSIKDVSFICVI